MRTVRPVGVISTRSPGSSAKSVLVMVGGVGVLLPITQFGYENAGEVLFVSNDCQGQPLVESGMGADFYRGAALVNDVLYYRNGTPTQVTVGSSLSNTGCGARSGTMTLSPA